VSPLLFSPQLKVGKVRFFRGPRVPPASPFDDRRSPPPLRPKFLPFFFFSRPAVLELHAFPPLPPPSGHQGSVFFFLAPRSPSGKRLLFGTRGFLSFLGRFFFWAPAENHDFSPPPPAGGIESNPPLPPPLSLPFLLVVEGRSFFAQGGFSFPFKQERSEGFFFFLRLEGLLPRRPSR